MNPEHLLDSPLGKEVEYSRQYDARLLYPMLRENLWIKRGHTKAPYVGVDIWNAYEISWLNNRGLPRVAVGEFRVPSNSPNLIESKSLKLYLCSFAQTRFSDKEKVTERIQSDLSVCAGANVEVEIRKLGECPERLSELQGTCLDDLDIEINTYERNSDLLQTEEGAEIRETIYSNLLKSNCPVTGQPDWGSVFIDYVGSPIDHASLLRYIVSYREHSDFHEQCLENIFLDMLERCGPRELAVYARYLRRGGLDINPYRSNNHRSVENCRLERQ
ncbi:MAG: NADPH-dependent 7-cyano-7-deazaguanine reductase QueF [Gammaproteobacteria bacterium]|nr:NADPH-dependent 7-cyano-7-deazaguanine reductase QueF [Gammaproteobacteria bacterium]